MGNSQSCISEAEVITEAQPFGKKKNIFFSSPQDGEDEDVRRTVVSRPPSVPPSDESQSKDTRSITSDATSFDYAVRVATLDSSPSPSSKPAIGCGGGGGGGTFQKYDPRCKTIKGNMFPWRKKKNKPEPMKTIGRTLKLDKHHSIVFYTPKKSHDDPMSAVEHETDSTYHNVPIESKHQFGTKSKHQQKEMRIRLLLKSAEEMRREVSFKSKGRKHCFVDTSIVCGIQIFVTRYDTLQPAQSSDYQSVIKNSGNGGYTKMQELEGMNVIKPTSIADDKVNDLISIFKEKVRFPLDSEMQDGSEQASVGEHQTEKKIYDLSGFHVGNFSDAYSALVPVGIGKQTFTPERLMSTLIDPVDDVICLDQENHVYVCDIGLTATQCDFIVDTTERCARGHYSAYTYAKQTLGCRDHDELAVQCEWPVMRAYASIMAHLERRFAKSLGGGGSKNATPRQLVLDEREPHVVKYDTSKKERQKLDTHTDKSEWTFIIALCDGNGKDYDGGGTYLESIDATIHLQKGHALIFPGKQRHRGQKIISGIRFLLVGFLVDKDELDEKDDNKKKSGE